MLLAALHRASDPPFAIVGDGPQRRALENLASSCGSSIRGFGWLPREEVDSLVGAARHVAIPSIREETANLVAVEALSAARPLLVSDRGALPELVASGAGIVADRGSDRSLRKDFLADERDDELCHRASNEVSRFARRWLGPETHMPA